MYVHHREELDVNAPDVPANQPPEDDGVCTSPPASPTCDDHSLVDGTALSRREAAMFLLKTKEIHKVSQSHLGGLIGDISFIVESTVQQLEKKVEGALENRGVGMNDDLRQIFHSPLVNDPFQGLHTEYLQKKYFREKFNLVVSLSGSY